MPFCSGVWAEVCKVSILLRWQNRTKSSAMYSPPLSLNSFLTFTPYLGKILVTSSLKTLACSDLLFSRKTQAYLVFPHMYSKWQPLLVRTGSGPHTSDSRYSPCGYIWWQVFAMWLISMVVMSSEWIYSRLRCIIVKGVRHHSVQGSDQSISDSDCW